MRIMKKILSQLIWKYIIRYIKFYVHFFVSISQTDMKIEFSIRCFEKQVTNEKIFSETLLFPYEFTEHL